MRYLVLFLLLVVYTPSFASPLAFGSESLHASIEAPDTWKAQPHGTGLCLSSPNGKTTLVVRLGDTEGKAASVLAHKIAGTDLQEIEPQVWTFFVTEKEFRIKNILRIEGRTYFLFSIAGDYEAAEKIVHTLKMN